MKSQIRMRASLVASRRDFLRSTLAFAGALGAAAALPRAACAAVVKEKRDPYRGLKMGMTSYTLRKFSLDEAIAMTRKAEVKYISLKDVHLKLTSTPEQCRVAREKIEKAGLTLMGGGVIYLKNDEQEIRHAFQYATNAGMATIVCSPDPAALDLVEQAAKEFKIRVAIHNHGPTDKHYPSPLDVLRLVEKRDPLMGVCMDVGHTVRIKVDPIEAIHQCKDRMYEFHMKDVTAPAAEGKPTEVGKGVIDIPAVLKALLEIKFSSQVALEYEANGDNPMPGVLESYAYIRGALAAL